MCIRDRGESAYTGFHGANRLASNSLLECLVMSKMCSKYITDGGIKKNHKTSLPSWDDSFVSVSTEKFIISHNWDELRKIMWNYVGIVRSNKRLKIAKEKYGEKIPIDQHPIIRDEKAWDKKN